MPAARRRFLLIANPAAGRLGRRLLEPTLAHLAGVGAVVTRAPVAGIDGARAGILAAIREASCDAVLVAGGDGSFRMAATALLGTPMPLGLIPLGTGNVLANELSLPTTPEVLAQVFLDGPTARLKAAQANGRPFFLMAGAGFDGAVIARLDQGLKQGIGKAAYVPAALQALTAPLPRLDVTVDGRKHEACWVIVSKARFYGGRFVLVPHTHALDDGLHAVLFQATSRAGLLRQLVALGRGALLGCRDVRILHCRAVSIRGHAQVEVDGDLEGVTPLDVTAGDAAVEVILPGGRRG